MLKRSKYGVFLSIKDSSILHLYDESTHRCKLLFDLSLNIKLNIEIDDDFSFNKSRLTCYASFDDLVLVGTGDGFLFIYSIEKYIKKKLEKYQKKFSLMPTVKKNNTRRNFSIGPQLLGKLLEKEKKIKRNSSLPCVLSKMASNPSLKKTQSYGFFNNLVSLDGKKKFSYWLNSLNEEKEYDYKMDLVTKVKISDQPVKCILKKKFVFSR